jgi:hypothetical protein
MTPLHRLACIFVALLLISCFARGDTGTRLPNAERADPNNLTLEQWRSGYRTAEDIANALVPAQLRLTHVSADKWRADYSFSNPVTSLEFWYQYGDYRKTKWRVLTPGIRLEKQGGKDRLTADGKLISKVSVEVDLYLAFLEDGGTLFNRFSDGGTSLSMGIFAASVKQGPQDHRLDLRVQLTGLLNEVVVTPPDAGARRWSFAYFGPTRPVGVGFTTQLVDPATPAWMVDVLQNTTTRITQYYAQAFGRRLSFVPFIMLSVDSVEGQGIGINGAAPRGQVILRVKGREALTDTPYSRRRLIHMIAHEFAHLWQFDIKRSGNGDNRNWIVEGGAEAIAVAGLRGSGLYTPKEADEYVAYLLQRCAAENGSVESLHGRYNCGFKRFNDLNTDIFKLWKGMIEIADLTGKPYTASLVNAFRSGQPGVSN